MKYLIVLEKGAFKYNVFYPVVKNCFQMAGRIDLFQKIVWVLTTEIHL